MRQALGWVLAGMVVPFLMGWADPPPDSDWQLETKARAALNGDATLRPLNLGVRVVSGRATGWGPVTTPELAKRAADLVGKVGGIKAVDVECHERSVEAKPRPVKPEPRAYTEAQPTGQRSAAKPAEDPAQLL